MHRNLPNTKRRHLTKFNRGINWLVIPALFACATTANGAPGGTGDRGVATTRPASAPEYDKEPLNVEFTANGLGEVVEYLRAVKNANIDVDWKRLDHVGVRRSTPVTIKMQRVKLSVLLRKILLQLSPEKQQLSLRDVDGVLVISTAEAFAAADKRDDQKLVVDPKVREMLDRVIPELRFDGVAMDDVLGFITDITGVKFRLDWKALDAAGSGPTTPIDLKIRNVKFSTVLSLILQDARDDKHWLTDQAEDGEIIIGVAKSR